MEFMQMTKRLRIAKPEIIEYRQLRAAAGGSGSSGGGSGSGGYKAGERVVCTVFDSDKHGYKVVIQKDNLPAVLASCQVRKPGEEIVSVFVCVHNGRILLSEIFSGTS